MATEKDLKIRLKDCKDQIETSIEQINVYMQEDNIVHRENIENIVTQLQTLNPIRLRGVCENSSNIIREIANLAQKELQRRGIEERLKAVESRGSVKKNKKYWFDSDSNDEDSCNTGMAAGGSKVKRQ